jgi:hypothetical protein
MCNAQATDEAAQPSSGILKQEATDHLVLRPTELRNKLLTIIGMDIIVIWVIPDRRVSRYLLGTSKRGAARTEQCPTRV